MIIGVLKRLRIEDHVMPIDEHLVYLILYMQVVVQYPNETRIIFSWNLETSSDFKKTTHLR